MKKHLANALRICILISMLIPAGIVQGMDTRTSNFSDSMDSSSGLYRTTIVIEQPYDLTRLEKMGVKILAQGESEASLLATESQLESLARLGLEPQASMDLGLLVAANAESVPWLANSMKGYLEQSTSIARQSLEDPEAGVESNAKLLEIIQGLSIEQSSALQALPGVDNDADGLTDTQESWWCTDPNNPDTDLDGRTDGAEIQTLKDWMGSRIAAAPGETPWSGWPFNPTTCPDKDYDSIPNLAERWELGLNMDLESTDRDKFDDGQELFGITNCPGGDNSCGYGDLPRSSDVGYVGQLMPSWVKAPGNHPLVAAYPMPEIDVVLSSLHVQTVTTVTTDHIISSGTERSYSTAKMEGTGTSVANTTTWNDWEEVSETTPMNGVQAINQDPDLPIPTSNGTVSQSLTSYQSVSVTVQQPKPKGLSGFGLVDGLVSLAEAPGKLWNAGIQIGEGINEGIFLTAAYGAPWNWNGHLDEYDEMQAREQLWKCQNGDTCRDPATGQLLLDGGPYAVQQQAQCSYDQNSCIGSGRSMGLSPAGASMQQSLPINVTVKIPPTPTKTETNGHSWGGAQTNTTEQYEEHTVTNGEAFSSEESWGNATAVDASHAADIWFTYIVKNSGTEYAREIGNLTFNLYIGDDPNPAYTYFVAPEIGGDGMLHNFLPGASHTYTAHRIPLTLDQMKAIDLGGTLRVVVEDYTYGADELFYTNAINAGLQIAIEDGMDDGNESIDSFVIPTGTGDSVMDVLGRYFPHTLDESNELTALWTPEYNRTDTPVWCVEPMVVGAGAARIVWCKHALTTADWWNIFTNSLGDGSLPLSQTNAVAGGTTLFRFNKDSDLDGYSDRSEARLGTDPADPASFPKPELLAGLRQVESGNNVVATLSLLNTGVYDAYGVEAVMVAPDDSITITNNTVGGSGRVKSGQTVVVGSRILPAVTGSWTGTARPASRGYYTGSIDRPYSFTVVCSNPGGCDVGAGTWSVSWSDGQGANGSLNFGSGYASPALLDVGGFGVKVGLVSGRVYNGNSFTVEARTPRDTFQYTINREPHAQPVVIVSYNDPQGNHRFILPDAAMHLAMPTQDLLPFAGQMRQDPGVEIVTMDTFQVGANTTNLVVNNSSGQSLVGARLFLDFIDPLGTVVHEASAVQALSEGPSIVPVVWDTTNFNPAYDPAQDYIVLAFWTDYEGNILDTDGRPLSSFQTDPQAQFAMSAADASWDFGTVSQGTLLQRIFTFANTGERELLTYVEAPAGLSVSQVGSRKVDVADQTSYEIVLNTQGLLVGAFSQAITIHTSDPENPIRTVQVSGTITEGAADVAAGDMERPLDYAVTVPGPQTQGTWYQFTQPIGPDPQSIHPVKVYSQDYSKLWGVGKYATDFNAGTASFEMFGDGRNGDLLVTAGQTISINTVRANTTASGNNVSVSSSDGFSVGDLVMFHQTQGTINVGRWEFATILAINSPTNWTLNQSLSNSYDNTNGRAQVIKIPQYKNVNIQSGGTLTAPIWDGATGGLLVFRVSETLTIDGIVKMSGQGYRAIDFGWQGASGEGTSGQGTEDWNANSSGGGGGTSEAGGGNGGGGGGHSTIGLSGILGSGGGHAGIGGNITGNSDLSFMVFGGAGGSGGNGHDSMPGHPQTEAQWWWGGSGGNSGGIIVIGANQLNLNGQIINNGNNGIGGQYSAAGGGGGSGGSVLIRSRVMQIGVNKIVAVGGNSGPGSCGDADCGMAGGNGASGRIRVEYCESLTGGSTPAASILKLNCFMSEQVETSPYTTTRLNVPENIVTSQTYAFQYGRRVMFTGAGDIASTLRIPANLLSFATLDTLISGVGTGSLTISLDIGNDSSTDYTWTGNVTDNIALEDLQLAPAFNRWWAANGRPTSGAMDVPVRISMSKAGQVVLTDLKINQSGSSLRQIQLESGNYSQVFLDCTLTGANGPITVGLDIGDDGTVDEVYTANISVNPQDVTSQDLATVFNAYLADKTGMVNVLVRFHLPDGVSVQLRHFTANRNGSLDVGLTAADILLPAAAPTEGAEVPVTVTLHNIGTLPSGSVVAAFFASTPGVGEWYIGSSLVSSVPAGGTTQTTIDWNTLGFTGDTTVRVIVDPYSRVAETDENNNAAQANIYIRTRPDLEATTLALSDSEPVLNEAITVSLIEANHGEADSSPSHVSVYDGDPQAGGVLLGESIVEVIGGSSASLDFTWTPTQTGWHRIFAFSDDFDQVSEYNEANNQKWMDVYVGFAGPLLLDSGTTTDLVYSATSGYGYLDINQPDVISSCGTNNLPEDTLRRDPDGRILYRFDHLQPGHFYHLDVTFYECDGAGRQQTVSVDENLISGIEDLGDGLVHRLSLRLDPVLYADRSITVAINAEGIDGAVIGAINLHDIDYRYADAGGGKDPQYPGNQEYGWLDGAAVLTWGTLPYRTVRVDQGDNAVRYQFDNLNPAKRYNVHFTFWQPSGTGRIQKVQVDGLDTGLNVNTGDYLLHQEKISVPLSAYSTDGSVVISIVRTNATTGAMVNEIALEEETVITAGNCVVQATPYFSETYGTALIMDVNAPAGTVIQAVNPRGDTVGCFTVTNPGNYGFMRIYGEDPSAVPAIPGMRAGELVAYKVNGAPAVSSPLFYWSDDHAAHNVNLNAGNITGQSILLQPGWNLISFLVEPPAPIVSSVLQSINGRYDRVLGEYGVYVPSLPDPFNTLNELHSATGYYLRVTGSTSVSLLVDGIAQPCTSPKQLHAGWNWIGAPCTVTPTATALQSINGHYQRVLSLNRSYDPALPAFSTLTELRPGEGYLIYITDPVTLTYPEGTPLNVDEQSDPVDVCDTATATPFATLVYGELQWFGRPVPVGSLVEFITPRGEVAGCNRIMDSGRLPLTHVFGSDGHGATGFADGEPLFNRINGVDLPQPLNLTWQDDKTPHEIHDLITGPSIYLPVIIN